jgi:hypothetical protein
MKLTGGKTKVLGGKTCPSATLSTTNSTWTHQGSNPGLRGQRPATKCLSHGTVCRCFLQSSFDKYNKVNVKENLPLRFLSEGIKRKELSCACTVHERV